MVVICFPGLEEPKTETWSGPDSEKSQRGTGDLQEEEAAQGSKSPSDITETPPTLNRLDSVDTEKGTFLNETERYMALHVTDSRAVAKGIFFCVLEKAQEKDPQPDRVVRNDSVLYSSGISISLLYLTENVLFSTMLPFFVL